MKQLSTTVLQSMGQYIENIILSNASSSAQGGAMTPVPPLVTCLGHTDANTHGHDIS